MATEHKIVSIQNLEQKSNGRGTGIWLVSWGLILFAFERYVGLSGWLMWAFRIFGLLCLLIGTVCIGQSFEGQKEQ